MYYRYYLYHAIQIKILLNIYPFYVPAIQLSCYLFTIHAFIINNTQMVCSNCYYMTFKMNLYLTIWDIHDVVLVAIAPCVYHKWPLLITSLFFNRR
jgi:hypothetical protein